MPQLCAFGCKPTIVPVHRFPNREKFPERFKLWVSLCGGKLDAASDNECYQKKIVCDKHFTDKDRNRNRRLNALAVPSLFLSGITACEDLISSVAGIADQHIHTSLHQLPMTNTPASEELMSNTTETRIGDRSSQLLCQHSMKGLTMGALGLQKACVLDEHNYTAASRHKQLVSKCIGPRFNSAQLNNMRTLIKTLRSQICRLRKNKSFKASLANEKN